jgi:membrane protease YdiL (CAAX protease family)
MSRERAVPRRATFAGVLILVAAAVLALRLAVVAAHPVSATERAWLLAGVYIAIAAASLLPALPRDRVILPAWSVAAIGFAAVALAWWTAGPRAPLAVTSVSVALSLAAAVAEEALFRRLTYGELLRFGVPAAVVGSALLFALVHIPAYGVAAFPVDLGAGMLFGWQRWASGTWTVPAATHAAANLLAVIR